MFDGDLREVMGSVARKLNFEKSTTQLHSSHETMYCMSIDFNVL